MADKPKLEIIRILVYLTFIAIVSIIGVFIFEQISVTYFHQLMFMNAHIFTIIMVGVLSPLATLIVILWFEKLNQSLLKENKERKAAEIKLRDAKAQAELYIDLMCHDINNMNQVSLGYLELAIDKITTEGMLGSENLIFLKKPFESLKNIAKLIENVRKLQKEQTGQLTLKPVDVGEALADVKSQYSNVPDRDITINYHLKKKCFVLANELLFDLYSNIVGNAIKHSSGPLVIDIGLSTILEDDQKYCIVTIEDNGPGISDELKKQLSDRLCLINVRYTGKGFGLCLIKTLIDDFKGKFKIEDRVPGDYSKGTKFAVLLHSVET
jgi:signal transduction histidine kinase